MVGCAQQGGEMNSSSSRQAILERIRAATQGAASEPAQVAAAYEALPRPYIRAGALSREECIRLFVERLRDYDAEVVECSSAEVPEAFAAQLTASGRRSFVVPAGIPASWRVPGFQFKIDGGLPADEIDRTEGVMTSAFCGVADSGTIALHHSASEGRRVVTLLPDWHLCVLRAEQVVETLPEYFARCADTPSLVTWISGPSATADIEMTRIKGVHGPRFLHVVLVRGA
jgi:L-lactate dehydrogenase complex protein LldG